MLENVINNWWVVLIRGICSILFGVLAFVWPNITLVVLILMYSAYALVDGFAAIVLGFQSRHVTGASWGSMVMLGVVSVIAGIVAFLWPGLTALALLYVVAFWAIVRGVLEIVSAVRLRHEIDNEWLLGMAGVASVLFGILLIAWPAAGILSLVWLVAVYAIVFGALQTALALRLRGLKQRVEHLPGTPAGA